MRNKHGYARGNPLPPCFVMLLCLWFSLLILGPLAIRLVLLGGVSSFIAVLPARRARSLCLSPPPVLQGLVPHLAVNFVCLWSRHRKGALFIF